MPPPTHLRALCQTHLSLCLLLNSFASLAQPLAASHLSHDMITCHKPFLSQLFCVAKWIQNKDSDRLMKHKRPTTATR